MLSRLVLLSLPCAALGYTILDRPVSLDDFKAEYNKNLKDVNTGTSAAVDLLKFNDLIRGTSEPASTGSENADAKFLWSWYSGVTGSAKSGATAFLNQVETDNMVHEQMLTTFNTQLQAALKQSTGDGDVAIDAKNYAAIFGDTLPVEGTPTTTGIRAGAVSAYTALQAMSTANQAKAKALAETRLYGSWLARFKKLQDSNRFTSTGGFENIVQGLKETLQTTASSDDTNGGESGWAVYNRVSAANKKLIKDALITQMALSTSAV